MTAIVPFSHRESGWHTPAEEGDMRNAFTTVGAHECVMINFFRTERTFSTEALRLVAVTIRSAVTMIWFFFSS